jgi:TetR/AcrR family transcriptional repressor of bet genes
MASRPASAAPKKRAEKKEATRQKLIAATLDSLASSGYAETTLSKVSKRAGVSRGLVNFHFDSKEHLLIEALKYLIEEYRQFWEKAVTRPGLTPVQRMLGLLDADFHPQVCNRKKIAVWYAFWGEARSRPTYLDVCASADRAFASMIGDLCRDLADDGGDESVDPAAVAHGLRTMIDGLWLEALLTPEQFDRVAAKRACLQFLSGVFPRQFHIDDRVMPLKVRLSG